MIIPSQHATDCRWLRSNAAGLLCAALLAAFLVAGCDEGQPEVKAEDRSKGWPGWTDVARGNGHTLAVAADGTLWAWGSNTNGQLGIGSNGGQQNAPVQAGSSHNWTRVVAGDLFSLGLQSDGSLWSWGYNAFGQLGLGDVLLRSGPTRVGTSKSWSQITAGNNFSLGLRKDGTLWAWGNNSLGQLGTGDNPTGHNTPTQVSGLWTQISAGLDFAVGLRTDGNIWGFGNQNNCKVGNTVCSGALGAPAMAAVSPPFVKVVAGGDFALALQPIPGVPGYSLIGWGSNSVGQLAGLGNPQAIPATFGQQCNDVGVGNDYTLCIATDGTLLTAGNDVNGALGNGGFGGIQAILLQAGTANTWAKVVPGGDAPTAGAYQSNGTLWLWGFGVSGAIGDGLGASSDIPVRIK
jgi:alpha-tubulin suppressor-like RCC1 family protein